MITAFNEINHGAIVFEINSNYYPFIVICFILLVQQNSKAEICCIQILK